jgi:surfeit locus 1 family protein
VGLLAVTVLAVALALRLGWWQLDRADQKERLQALMQARGSAVPIDDAGLLRLCCADPAALHYRPAHLRGQWVPEHTVFLENRQMVGRPGFFVVTPLRLEGRPDAVLLVQRGWVPRDSDERTRLPTLSTPTGTVELDGLIAPPPARLYEFSAAASGPIRQNLDIAGFAAQTGLALLPVSLQQRDPPSGNAHAAQPAGDRLLRQWPQPTIDVQKHYGYAFQWFALGALMAGLYVWFQFVRPWRRRRG